MPKSKYGSHNRSPSCYRMAYQSPRWSEGNAHIYIYQKVPIHTYIHKHPFQHIHLIYGRSVAEGGRSYRHIHTNIIIDNRLLAGALLGVNPSCGTHLYNFDQTHRSQNNIQNENKKLILYTIHSFS